MCIRFHLNAVIGLHYNFHYFHNPLKITEYLWVFFLYFLYTKLFISIYYRDIANIFMMQGAHRLTGAFL